MKEVRIPKCSRLVGTIEVPPDKSISHRSVILGGLSKSRVKIKNFLCSKDCLATIDSMRKLGVDVEGYGTPELTVAGRGLKGLKRPLHELDLGNSGTGLRLLTGIVSAYPFTTILTGDESLRRRPMERIIDPLTQMGAKIEALGGGDRCPLKVTGRSLKGIYYKSPIPSAQVKSAILLAGLNAEGITTVEEPFKSRDHTERLLMQMGADLKIKGLQVSIKGGIPIDIDIIEIPGDISSASFFIVGACIIPGSRVTVKNVGLNPTRTGIIEILQKMGAEIKIEAYKDVHEPVGDVTITYTHLKPISITKDRIPYLIDELPIIAVACAVAEGESIISGAEELRVKESDRVHSVADNLRRMGVGIEERHDGWVINGGNPFKSAVIDSYGDHRIAMAMSIASLLTKDGCIIRDVEWVDTSFPGFYDLLFSLIKE